VRTGKKEVVDENGQTMTLVFNPTGFGFVLKDGISGGWISKSLAENDYRLKRREVLAKKEKDHFHTATLVPNYEGQEAHCWVDVRDHARSVKGEASARTYDRLVQQEKGTT